MAAGEKITPYPLEERQKQLAILAGVLLERAGKEEYFPETGYYELRTEWLPARECKLVKVVYSDFDTATARLDVSTHNPGENGVRANTVAINNRHHEAMANHWLPDGIENLTGLLASALALQAAEEAPVK